MIISPRLRWGGGGLVVYYEIINSNQLSLLCRINVKEILHGTDLESPCIVFAGKHPDLLLTIPGMRQQ